MLGSSEICYTINISQQSHSNLWQIYGMYAITGTCEGLRVLIAVHYVLLNNSYDETNVMVVDTRSLSQDYHRIMKSNQ